ncbi:NnrU family protein [Govanella unica]|uniref:NnrU family protein n=1 Tax=Govanella unica TaxID=2975056 RepID=A0A9X3Z6P6_9PROT|nr:NnrU family protein [Govania unica]MDA5193425.1 NnrU family protein [Govania unica]
MLELAVASLLFLGIHVASSTGLRARMVRVLGENGFRGLFSILSIGAIFWMVQAYNRAPVLESFWSFGLWARLLALAVMVIAFFLVLCGLSVPNPTTAGFEKAMAAPEPARGILRITRHPFLWGVGLWALVHLLNNGDPASVIFFGSLALLSFGGTLLVDRKKRRTFGEDWHKFADVTSNLPFAAILAGRNHMSFSEIGWWRLLLSVVLFVAMLSVHARLFGVTPLP